MADEGDQEVLTNGEVEMDGAETHEMTDMNGTLEKGRKNTGFEGDEEEETTPIINDSSEETEYKDNDEEIPPYVPENIEDQEDSLNDTNEETEFKDNDEEIPAYVPENIEDQQDNLNDTHEETEFKDDDDEIPPYEPENIEDHEDSSNGTETATEYENHVGTLNSRKEDELETPEYTPPGSPAAEHTAVNMENPTYDNVDESDEKFRFVQHEGDDEETTRAESRRRFKRKTDYKCLCLSLLCFMVMLLAAAFAFFVAMFLVGSLDGFLGRNGKEEVPLGTAPTARPPGADTIPSPPITMIMTQAQIELEMEWNQNFDFPSAQDRIDLEIAVIAALDDTYRWSSTKYVYKNSEIGEFRRGPFASTMFVEFNSFFYDVPDGVIVSSTTPTLEEQYELAKEEMSQIVFNTLAAAIDEQSLLGRIQARQGTLELLLTEITRAA